MQIKELLKEGKFKLIQNEIDDASIQSKILMQFVLKQSQSFIIACGEKQLEEYQVSEYKSYIDKIIEGKPIQYITNNQEFMKLNFYVDENVLIPQPDTEILVEEVINNCNQDTDEGIIKDSSKEIISKIEILDLCTGSGAIGISLAKYIKECKVTCTDICMKALQIAKLNAEKNLVHKNMEFILSDLFENLQKIKFDIIVSNPPYIKTEVINTLKKPVQNEPHLALDGGKDGLDFYKKIIKNAPEYLNPNGKIYLEIGYDQKEDVIRLLEDANQYKSIKCIQDLAGNDRVIIARMRE